MAQWFVQVNGRSIGPMDERLVQTWIRNGRLDADTPIRKRSSDEWTSLGTVKRFAPALDPNAPWPPRASVYAQGTIWLGCVSLAVAVLLLPILLVIRLIASWAGLHDWPPLLTVDILYIGGLIGSILCAGATIVMGGFALVAAIPSKTKRLDLGAILCGCTLGMAGGCLAVLQLQFWLMAIAHCVG
jgi:hypothetical protein